MRKSSPVIKKLDRPVLTRNDGPYNAALIFNAGVSKLNGKYTKSEGLIEQSFIFNNDGTVKVSAFDIEIEGEYEIKDGKITITYSLLGLSYDWVKDFDKKGNSIFIDGTEFVKEK